MADDRCETAFSAADRTGPRKYYRARYYDPKLGRFSSEDPIGFMGGVNYYLYVDARPTVVRDPSGLDGDTRTIWLPFIGPLTIRVFYNQEDYCSCKKLAEERHEQMHQVQIFNMQHLRKSCAQLEQEAFQVEANVLTELINGGNPRCNMDRLKERL
jgi:RHS repeat-associated protein